MSIPTGAAFAKALEEAGVISDLNSIMRVVIDITGAECRLYVERVGDKKLLDAIKGPLGMMLADASREPDAPKGVRYWTSLPADLDWGNFVMRALKECGLRIIEEGPRTASHSQMYLIEDPEAPKDLADRTVELVFEQVEDAPVRVAQRNVIA